MSSCGDLEKVERHMLTSSQQYIHIEVSGPLLFGGGRLGGGDTAQPSGAGAQL